MPTQICFSTPLQLKSFSNLKTHFSTNTIRSRPSIPIGRQRHSKLYQWKNELSKEFTKETSPNADRASQYHVKILRSIKDISKQKWDRFATKGCASPFLRHDWLRCLEQADCASVNTGWLPHHIVLTDTTSNQVVALAPAYIKQHSLGEFVFDQEWAEAAYAAGILYYPKLLLAVPFTPATGRRILTLDEPSRKHLLTVTARALLELCHALPVSSVHVNFCAKDEMEALSAVGFLQRKGIQYHFTNYRKGQSAITQFEQSIKSGNQPSSFEDFVANDIKRIPYTNFEDYLSEFKSKKRIKMRRERSIVRNESDVTIEIVRGEQITTQLMQQMFDIYKSTIDKLLYGRQYLTSTFFELLSECEEFKKHICLVVARDKNDGEIVGGTFNIIGEEDGGAFYGRYWGCMKEIRYLHFEVCYYAAIEYCVENGLSRMEPGAGGGDFKYMRGFEPSVTISMHYLKDERLSNAVARYLDMEEIYIDGAVSDMKKSSAIRSKVNGNDQSSTN